MYTSFAAVSTSTPAGRFSVVVLLLPSDAPGLPICSRNLPSRENLSTCASAGRGGAAAAPPPLPPFAPRPAVGASIPAAVIQTLPLASTAIAPGDTGQS